MAYTVPLYQLGTQSIGIQHKQTAGQQFDGSQPTGTQTQSNGCCKYAAPGVAAAAGGLFDVGAGEPWVGWLYADLGASVAYVVTVENLDASGAVIAGEGVQIAAASGRFVNLGPYRLLTRQALKLVTTGSSTAMVARVVAISEKGYRG